MSDAQDRLRQYLEQRREAGESEFVLDTLSVEDALKALGSKGSARGSTSASSAPSAFQGGAPASPPRDSEKRRAAETAAASGDWREALRNVNAERPDQPAQKANPKPSTEPRTPPFSVPSVPSVVKGSPPSSSQEDPKPITIGGSRSNSGRDDLKTLEEVAKAIATCHACTLSGTAKNHVPGEGNPHAKFVVVGEAPGATEDELGRPFVGKSGDLLEKILGAIGLARSDVFICNVLKHRPPGNRNPASDEIVSCRPFLLRQLELMDPKVILALGTFAAQTLLETDSPIGKLRGIEHRYHGIPLVATYHPAALLRNPNWKRPAWEDVQLARRILDRA